MGIELTTLSLAKKYTDKKIEEATVGDIDLSDYVQSVNGISPDNKGNVEIKMDISSTEAVIYNK